MPGIVFLVEVWVFGLSLLPILMFGNTYQSFMPATADCTPWSPWTLCPVVVKPLAVVAAHRFRNVGPGPIFAKMSHIDVFWNKSREGAENGPGRVTFSVFQSLCTGNIAEFG